MNELTAGDQVGRFVVQQALGEGGMGTVFEAIDTMLNRHVALKFLRPGKMDPELLLRGSIRESRVLAELNHQNIVHLYDVGMHEGCPYFVMELVRGKSLRVLCNAFGTLETFDALGVSVQIGEGLCAAHGAGIIHNDLKPENVMMTAQPAGHVKLVDFGLSRTVERASTGTTGELIDGKGTPHYMAPELHRGDRATEKSDVYSWGQITHEMLTGRFLFERSTGDIPTRREVGRLHLLEHPISIVEIRGESLAAVERIVFRMLSKNPDDRPTSREALQLVQRELARLEVELPMLSDRTLTAEVSRPPTIVQVVSPVGVEETGPRTEPQGTFRGRIATLRMERPQNDAAPPTPVSPVFGMPPPPVFGMPPPPVSSASPVTAPVGVPSSNSSPPEPSSGRVSARSGAPSSAPRVSENLRRVLTTQIGSAVRTSVAASDGSSIEMEGPNKTAPMQQAPRMWRDLTTGEYRRLSYMSTEPLERARETRSSDRGGWSSSPVGSPDRLTPPFGVTPERSTTPLGGPPERSTAPLGVTPDRVTSPVLSPRVDRAVPEPARAAVKRPPHGSSRLWLGAVVGLTSAAAAFLVYLRAVPMRTSGAPVSGVPVGEAPMTSTTTNAVEPALAREDAGPDDAGPSDAGEGDAGLSDAGTKDVTDDAGPPTVPPTLATPATAKKPSIAPPPVIPSWRGPEPVGGRTLDDDLFRPKDTPPKKTPPKTSPKTPPATSAAPAPSPKMILPFGMDEP